MNLHEYQGKSILREYGVPVPDSLVVNTPEDAYNCFMGTDLDKLFIGNCYLEKEKQLNSLKKNYIDKYGND